MIFKNDNDTGEMQDYAKCLDSCWYSARVVLAGTVLT